MSIIRAPSEGRKAKSVLLKPMADKKRPASNVPQKKSGKVPLAPASKAPKTPVPIEQADGSPKPTNTESSRATKTADDSASSMLRCYNIPDYRLERPEFRIFMSGEEIGRASCRERV